MQRTSNINTGCFLDYLFPSPVFFGVNNIENIFMHFLCKDFKAPIHGARSCNLNHKPPRPMSFIELPGCGKHEDDIRTNFQFSLVAVSKCMEDNFSISSGVPDATTNLLELKTRPWCMKCIGNVRQISWIVISLRKVKVCTVASRLRFRFFYDQFINCNGFSWWKFRLQVPQTSKKKQYATPCTPNLQRTSIPANLFFCSHMLLNEELTMNGYFQMILGFGFLKLIRREEFAYGV